MNIGGVISGPGSLVVGANPGLTVGSPDRQFVHRVHDSSVGRPAVRDGTDTSSTMTVQSTAFLLHLGNSSAAWTVQGDAEIEGNHHRVVSVDGGYMKVVGGQVTGATTVSSGGEVAGLGSLGAVTIAGDGSMSPGRRL